MELMQINSSPNAPPKHPESRHLRQLGIHQYGAGLWPALRTHRTFIRPVLQYGLAITPLSRKNKKNNYIVHKNCTKMVLNRNTSTPFRTTVPIVLADLPSMLTRIRISQLKFASACKTYRLQPWPALLNPPFYGHNLWISNGSNSPQITPFTNYITNRKTAILHQRVLSQSPSNKNAIKNISYEETNVKQPVVLDQNVLSTQFSTYLLSPVIVTAWSNSVCIACLRILSKIVLVAKPMPIENIIKYVRLYGPSSTSFLEELGTIPVLQDKIHQLTTP